MTAAADSAAGAAEAHLVAVGGVKVAVTEAEAAGDGEGESEAAVESGAAAWEEEVTQGRAAVGAHTVAEASKVVARMAVAP